MTDPDERPAPTAGGTTPGKGTPVPVDVSGDPRGQRAIAMFVAGPLIWTAHFLLVYLVVEAGCTGDGPGLRLFDPPVPTVVTLAATVAAAVGCLVAARWAYRGWRAAPDERGGPLALAGALLSLLGVVTVVFVGLPALVLPAC